MATECKGVEQASKNKSGTREVAQSLKYPRCRCAADEHGEQVTERVVWKGDENMDSVRSS